MVGFKVSAVTVGETIGTYQACIESIGSGDINPTEPDIPFTISVVSSSTAQGNNLIPGLVGL